MNDKLERLFVVLYEETDESGWDFADLSVSLRGFV